MSDTDDVLAIEKGFWTHADQPEYFDRHVADGGLIVIEPMGFLQKPQAVAMPADTPWTEVEMSDVESRQIIRDCVILAYHGRGFRAGDEKPYDSSVASTYVRQDGAWRLALSAHQPWAPKANEDAHQT